MKSCFLLFFNKKKIKASILTLVVCFLQTQIAIPLLQQRIPLSIQITILLSTYVKTTKLFQSLPKKNLNYIYRIIYLISVLFLQVTTEILWMTCCDGCILLGLAEVVLFSYSRNFFLPSNRCHFKMQRWRSGRFQAYSVQFPEKP